MANELKQRLDKGPVICAEGFLFEIERRGYMASGEFVPMVSLDHPEVLENLHREFQHAGLHVEILYVNFQALQDDLKKPSAQTLLMPYSLFFQFQIKNPLRKLQVLYLIFVLTH